VGCFVVVVVVTAAAFGAGALDGGVAELFFVLLFFLLFGRSFGFVAGDQRRALNGGYWERRREIRWIRGAHHCLGDTFGFELECVAGVADLEVRVERLCVVRVVRKVRGVGLLSLAFGGRCFRPWFRGLRFRLL
jgi:hypothetical protein